MIGMTAYAFLTRAGRNAIRSVQSTLLRHPRPNVRMAANAFELRLTAAQPVAFRAVSRSVEELMLPRQWSRGNLCCRPARQQSQRKKQCTLDRSFAAYRKNFLLRNT